MSKIHTNIVVKHILLSLLILFLFIASLSALNITGNTGFSIPIGNWSTYHNSSPFFTLETNLINKNYLNSGISFSVSTFSGKLNESYTLQILSPGAFIKFYPLFFKNNYNIFINSTLGYSFMEKNLHNSRETGGDFNILMLIGGKFKLSENWSFSTFLGEKHFMGRIDLLIFGLGIEFKK